MNKLSLILLSHLALQTTFAQTVTQSQTVQGTFNQYLQQSGVNGTGGRMTAFTINEATQGSPYLLDHWTLGKVVLKTGATYSQPDSSLNFDKGKQVLILKLPGNQVYEMSSDDVKSFELYDSGRVLKFSYVADNPHECYQQLYSDSQNTLYKRIQTTFYKADYVNKGLYESGYRYDRYVDKIFYYIKPAAGEWLKLENVSRNKLKKLSSVIPGIADALQHTTENETDTDKYLVYLVSNIKKNQ